MSVISTTGADHQREALDMLREIVVGHLGRPMRFTFERKEILVDVPGSLVQQYRKGDYTLTVYISMEQDNNEEEVRL